jgi:hypothetical protein
LAAVTLTPGSGVLPFLVEPLISYAGAAAGVVADCGVAGGEGGAASCAHKLDAKKTATNWSTNIPRAINFKSESP